MQRLSFWLCLLIALIVNAVHGAEAPKELPSIREFDVDTISRLGRELYQHDQLAWVATDVVMDKVGMKRLQEEGARGWVVDTSQKDQSLVRFVRAKGDGVEAAYDIVFVAGKKPKLVEPKRRELTEYQQARFVALQAAGKELLAGHHPWCGGNPNNVVLDDPDGSGFLVYFLRPKPSPTAVPVGGHYRITVSERGKVEQVDQLFASCLTLDRAQMPNGDKIAALFMAQVVSDIPLETNVFLSLQEKLPFLISMKDGKVWSIKGAIVSLTDTQLKP